jgi:hypothetical protein
MQCMLKQNCAEIMHASPAHYSYLFIGRSSSGLRFEFCKVNLEKVLIVEVHLSSVCDLV